MDKQGKSGSNAVDEEEKRQVRAMGEGRAFDAPGAQKMCTHPAKGAERKHERPTTPFSPLHHNKRNNRQGNQGEYRG